MIDLSIIPAEKLTARGAYSTVRAAHEDEKKSLAMLCGDLSSISTKILRAMQPDNKDIPENYEVLIQSGAKTLSMIEQCAKRIESLARQKLELKQTAWNA